MGVVKSMAVSLVIIEGIVDGESKVKREEYGQQALKGKQFE